MMYQLENQNFRGNILISKNDQVIFTSSTGLAERSYQVANHSSTRFASASAGKVFVSIGILQLIEQNKLSLKSTLNEILSIDLGQIDMNVTIEQLLTHTSGVPDYFDESVMDDYEELWKDFPNYRIRRNQDLLPLFIHKPMQYPKGTKFSYNNSGFVLLGLIIEEITQMPFDLYLKKHVFDPCNMSSTGYFELDRLPSDCATNYISDEETNSYRSNIYSVDAKGTGAGGCFITVEDIQSFWQALLSYRLLSKEMTEHMLSVHAEDEDSAYGYGIWIRKRTEGNSYYFTGSDPGVSFMSEYCPFQKVLTILVSNYGDHVWELNRLIIRDIE